MSDLLTTLDSRLRGNDELLGATFVCLGLDAPSATLAKRESKAGRVRGNDEIFLDIPSKMPHHASNE